MIDNFRNNTAEMYYTGGYDTPHNLDLQAIKYFMPIVEGKVGGVYEVEAVQTARKSDKNLHNDNPNDGVRLFLMLGDFIPFGDKLINAQNRVHNGEVKSLKDCEEFYNGLKG